MSKTKDLKDKKPKEQDKELEELHAQLADAKDREKRALADYQNLVKRTATDRLNLARFANRELIDDLLEPLEHLGLAAEQIEDDGLNLVVESFWQVLHKHGLERIEALNQDFDVETMEAVETKKNDAKKVVKVIKPGFKLSGTVIQHAKVVLG